MHLIKNISWFSFDMYPDTSQVHTAYHKCKTEWWTEWNDCNSTQWMEVLNRGVSSIWTVCAPAHCMFNVCVIMWPQICSWPLGLIKFLNRRGGVLFFVILACNWGHHHIKQHIYQWPQVGSILATHLWTITVALKGFNQSSGDVILSRKAIYFSFFFPKFIQLASPDSQSTIAYTLKIQIWRERTTTTFMNVMPVGPSEHTNIAWSENKHLRKVQQVQGWSHTWNIADKERWH